MMGTRKGMSAVMSWVVLTAWTAFVAYAVSRYSNREVFADVEALMKGLQVYVETRLGRAER